MATPDSSPSAETSSIRERVGRWLDSTPVQATIVALILVNTIVLGLETSDTLMAKVGGLLFAIDKLCLVGFVLELAVRMYVERFRFFRSGWNWFDTLVVGVALLPGAGPWAVLRAWRVLRVLRLLTVVPQLRRVVAAFLHAIPGLISVIAVMGIFFYTAAVLTTNLFGETHPQWFGTIGESLYTLFQVMTLESWSMGIVRPTMEAHPWAWAFFVPFIFLATFTILNLFIGIIVSTMTELAHIPDPREGKREILEVLSRLEQDLQTLRALVPESAEGATGGASTAEGESP